MVNEDLYCHFYLDRMGTGDIISENLDSEDARVYCYRLEGECPFNNQGKMVQLEDNGRYYMICLSHGFKQIPRNSINKKIKTFHKTAN